MAERNVHQVWSEDELDTALAALHSDRDTDERALARTRAELVMAAGGSVPPQPSTPDPVARRRWGRWAAAAAVVVALVAGALIIQTVPFGDKPPAASAAAAALNSAADKIRAADLPVAPGQYRYIATHAWRMTGPYGLASRNNFSYLAEELTEDWVPADQSQKWLMRITETGERKWVQGTEEDARAAGVPIDEVPPPRDQWNAPRSGSWQEPNPQWLAGLPRDPQQLYDRLRADAPVNSRGDAELLVYAADALRSGLVPADVRAALYRALAKLPGLEITDQLANLDGRVGIAYGMSDGHSRHEIIIDPATGEFIGERETLITGTDGMKAGTVMSYTSVSTSVVNEMGVRPAG